MRINEPTNSGPASVGLQLEQIYLEHSLPPAGALLHHCRLEKGPRKQRKSATLRSSDHDLLAVRKEDVVFASVWWMQWDKIETHLHARQPTVCMHGEKEKNRGTYRRSKGSGYTGITRWNKQGAEGASLLAARPHT